MQADDAQLVDGRTQPQGGISNQEEALPQLNARHHSSARQRCAGATKQGNLFGIPVYPARKKVPST